MSQMMKTRGYQAVVFLLAIGLVLTQGIPCGWSNILGSSRKSSVNIVPGSSIDDTKLSPANGASSEIPATGHTDFFRGGGPFSGDDQTNQPVVSMDSNKKTGEGVVKGNQLNGMGGEITFGVSRRLDGFEPRRSVEPEFPNVSSKSENQIVLDNGKMIDHDARKFFDPSKNKTTSFAYFVEVPGNYINCGDHDVIGWSCFKTERGHLNPEVTVYLGTYDLMKSDKSGREIWVFGKTMQDGIVLEDGDIVDLDTNSVFNLWTEKTVYYKDIYLRTDLRTPGPAPGYEVIGHYNSDDDGLVEVIGKPKE